MKQSVTVVHIIHRDGIPLVTVVLEEGSSDTSMQTEHLFGGLTSAISTMIRHLGHKQLRSINVEDGLLVYSYRDPVFFVAHTRDPEGERFASMLVKQVEYEFFEEFGASIHEEDSYVDGARYAPFKSTVVTLYGQMLQIEEKFPRLLEFLPSFIPLHFIYMAMNLVTEMTERFPDGMVRVLRRLPLYFEDALVRDTVAQTLGKYLGYRVAKDRFERSVLAQEDVLRLLNEVSVCEYDRSRNAFDLTICPECRARKSDKPMCFFFAGFIEGALANPAITVRETACRACGDSSCSFQLYES
ncbi:MAG: V4R domain-containing protein [Candidatus Thorarchaeota archaeon]